MSAEVEKDILEKLRLSLIYIEDKINEAIEAINYPIELESWDCIVILMKQDDPNYTERTQYSKKKQDMDFRLKIDYQTFSKTDDLGRQRMIYQMLERSLDILLEKGLSETGIEQLRNDVRAVALENGWLNIENHKK